MSNEPQYNNYNVDTSGVKETTERKSRGTKQVSKHEDSQASAFQRFADFFRNGRTKLAIGVMLMMIAAYLLLTFMSFILTSGSDDQNRVQSYSITENARAASEVHNLGGSVGASISQFLIADGVGLAAFIIVLWCGVIGYRLATRKSTYFYSYTLISLISMFTLSMSLGLLTYAGSPSFFHLGGDFGFYANQWLNGLFGVFGMIAINIILVLSWVLLCFKTLQAMWNSIKKAKARLQHIREKEQAKSPDYTIGEFLGDREQGLDIELPQHKPNKRNEKKNAPLANEIIEDEEDTKNKKLPDGCLPITRRIKGNSNKGKKKGKGNGDDADFLVEDMKNIEKASNVSNPGCPTGSFRHYRFPTLDLMADIKMKTNSMDIGEQESNEIRITETLRNYGIGIKQITAHVGPTVTLFEIVPEDGVRISKIRGLEDDIALSLAALGIRIIAPMPGRGTIGIEVPNRDPQTVPMREVLASKAFQETKCALPMVLGCTVSNDVFVADLTKMPHLLVAGATGQGKSVGLNAIITSLLYKKGPSELKFVLIDPKKVEFSIYADLEKYYFAKVEGEDQPIITETDKVVRTLNSLVQEMENRYDVLQRVGERKLEDYNRRWRNSLRNEVDDATGELYKYMPYIVVIVDEFSDLIMTAGKEVETPIVRIAQKARAVGIHMIIATQRPSANVITGLIKANFPGRIAFRVSQSVDSRIILDRLGAQQLIGKGDMLFSANGEITRLQCPFVDTPDIVNLCGFIKEQEDADRDISHDEPFLLPEYVGDSGSGDFDGSVGGSGDRDPLFEEAAKWIVQGDTASTSSLQRRYQIGYNRAGRIMDQMEKAGIVGPAQGGKPRKVLVDPMHIDQLFS